MWRPAVLNERCLSCVFMLLTLAVAQVSPGAKVTLTQRGLEYAKTVGVASLLSSLQHISVDDIHGTAGTPIGDISFDLTGISLSGLQIGSSAIQIVSGSGLQLTCGGVGMNGHLDWHYRENSWPHVSDSGSADLSVSGASIAVQLTVGVDSTGRPTVQVASAMVNLGNLSINLHGGASWLYNLFVSLFNSKIEDAAERALHDAVVREMNSQVASALAKVPIVEPIDEYCEINYKLTAAPVFAASTYLSSPHLGEFYWTANPTEAPFKPVALPDLADAQMLQVFLSDFTVNSAGYAYWKASRLNFTLLPDKKPSWLPIELNTSSLQDLVPALYATYPNLLMRVDGQLVAPPAARFTAAQGLQITAAALVDFQVVLPNSSVVSAFALNVGPTLEGTLAVNGTMLTGVVTLLNATLSLNSSSIGDVDADGLQALVNLGLVQGVVPALNKFGAKGYPLPVMKDLQLVSPQISFGSGYVAVTSDVKYT